MHGVISHLIYFEIDHEQEKKLEVLAISLKSDYLFSY